jgi:hypothetical protein
MANAVYQHGLKVAFVEKDRMRGASINRGCKQSKLLIHVANLAETIKRAELFGIRESSIRWHPILIEIKSSGCIAVIPLSHTTPMLMDILLMRTPQSYEIQYSNTDTHYCWIMV